MDFCGNGGVWVCTAPNALFLFFMTHTYHDSPTQTRDLYYLSPKNEAQWETLNQTSISFKSQKPRARQHPLGPR